MYRALLIIQIPRYFQTLFLVLNSLLFDIAIQTSIFMLCKDTADISVLIFCRMYSHLYWMRYGKWVQKICIERDRGRMIEFPQPIRKIPFPYTSALFLSTFYYEHLIMHCCKALLNMMGYLYFYT